MTEEQKNSIIRSAKDFFRSIIIPKHLENLEGLKLKSFDINPFLINYLAAFLCGDTTPESLAKALVYPRTLGTSINTSFGQNTQIFISSLNEIVGNASGIEGIDIEFVDAIDGRKKYCQCKAGTETLSQKDVLTTLKRFKKLKKYANENNLPLQDEDMIVGIWYRKQASSYYDIVEQLHTVYSETDFWHHLTGDEKFYYRIAKAFGEVLLENKIDSDILMEKEV